MGVPLVAELKPQNAIPVGMAGNHNKQVAKVTANIRNVRFVEGMPRGSHLLRDSGFMQKDMRNADPCAGRCQTENCKLYVTKKEILNRENCKLICRN